MLSTVLSFLSPLVFAADGGLLSIVPDEAYVIVHAPDAARLRTTAERNDWMRLLRSEHGRDPLDELVGAFESFTRTSFDATLPVAEELTGEVVFFDTEAVAGFATTPPVDPTALRARMRAWLPGDVAGRRTVDVAGATLELVAWPDETADAPGRSGHYAAFLEHARAFALYSGDDAAVVMDAAKRAALGLEAGHRAPLVERYVEAGAACGGDLGVFVDFDPFVADAEDALRRAYDGGLPAATGFLGLEQGTSLHAHVDVHAGTGLEARGRLALPPGTLIAELADTFQPLPRTLPADLPAGLWALHALRWDVRAFYARARRAYEEGERAEALATVDAGRDTARGLAGVDPVDDVLNRLTGTFALYSVEPAGTGKLDDMDLVRSLGYDVGLVDGAAFLTAFEEFLGTSGLQSALVFEDLAGADAWVLREAAEGIDGGLAFLDHFVVAAPTRAVLERAVRALLREPEASLSNGGRMQAVLDEHAGACFVGCLELTPLKRFLPLDEELRLPPVNEGEPPRDPFAAQLIGIVRRTPAGLDFELKTR